MHRNTGKQFCTLLQRMLQSFFVGGSAVILLVLSLFCVQGIYGQYSYQPQKNDNYHQGWWNTEYNTTEGTEFYVTFMTNGGTDDTYIRDLHLYIYATSKRDAEVIIKNPRTNDTISFKIKAFEQNEIKLEDNNSWAYIGEKKNNKTEKGIIVSSTEKISLYITNQHASNKTSEYDASNILPTNALQKEYVVQTYRGDGTSTEFAVIAANYGTILQQIRIKKILYDEQEMIVDSVSDILNEALQLDNGETFQYTSATKKDENDQISSANTSLSGSFMCFNKPVSLMVGGQQAVIKPCNDINTSTTGNHIFSQAYPTDKWGKTFVVTPTYGMVYDYVKITACVDNTIIYKNGEPIDTINAFDTFKDTLTSELIAEQSSWTTTKFYTPNAAIYSTSNISECFLYATDRSCNFAKGYDNGVLIVTPLTSDYGSPTLTPIIPQEYGMHHNIFATFKSTTSDGVLNHYVNIVTRTSEINNMYIDSNKISDLSRDVLLLPFTEIANSEYSYAILKVSLGAHNIENRGGEEYSIFTARVYGLGAGKGGLESYAYAAGARVSHSADMLIDDKYIKEKSICIGEEVRFSAVVNYEYDTIEWISSLDTIGVTSGSKDSVFHKRFTESGTDTVKLVIKSTTPLCNYQLIDTIKARIIVVNTTNTDTLLHNDSIHNGNICLGTTFQLLTHKGTYNDSTSLTFTADTSIYQQTLFNGERIKFKLDTEYIFIDSIRTIREPHCDSIIRTRFTIRPVPYISVSDTICVNYAKWPFIKQFKENQLLFPDSSLYDTISLPKDWKSALNRHRTGEVSPKIKTDTIVLHNQYGCDSTIHYSLIVLPVYNIKETDVPNYCADSINPYIWSIGHNYSSSNHTDYNGKPLKGSNLYLQKNDETLVHVTEPIILKDTGVYILTDSLYTRTCKCYDNNTRGCDSVYTVKITVLGQTKIATTTTLCEDSFFVWRDTLYLGPKCDIGSVPIRLKVYPYYQIGNTTLKNIRESKVNGICDTIYTNKVTWCPTYDNTDVIHICEGEPYNYQPRYPETSEFDHTYIWTCKNGQVKDTTLHSIVETIVRCNGDRGCDSVVTHKVYVHPKAHHKDTVRICQKELPYYIYYTRDNDTIRTDIVDIEGWTGGTFDEKTAPFDSLLPQCNIPVEHNIEGWGTFDCDSIVQHHIIVYPSYHIEENTTICDGDYVIWESEKRYGKQVERTEKEGSGIYGNKKYIDSTYSRTFTALGGCDSVRVLNLHVSQKVYRDTIVKGCAPVEFDFNGRHRGPYLAGITSDTIYEETNKLNNTTDGCDSYEVLRVHVGKNWEIDEEPIIINDKTPFSWEGKDYGVLPVGTHPIEILLHTKNYGCDSIRRKTVVVQQTHYTLDTEHICEGDDYTWRGHKGDIVYFELQYKETPYTFFDSLKTIEGQDSVFELRIYVHRTYDNQTEVVHKCADEMPYIWKVGNSQINFPLRKKLNETDTIHKDTTLTSQFGCDSLVHLLLYVHPVYKFVAYDTICQDKDNPSDIFQGPWYDATDSMLTGSKHSITIQRDTVVTDTIYSDKLKTVSCPSCPKGYCDSIYELHLTVLPSYHFDTTRILSEEDTLHWQGTVYGGRKSNDADTIITKDTILYRHYTTSSILHCDSNYTLHVTIGNVLRENEFDTICGNETEYRWTRNNTLIKVIMEDSLPEEGESSEYQEQHKTILGFDSIYTLHLYRDLTYKNDTTAEICQGGNDGFYHWSGHNENQTGQPDYLWDEKRQRRIDRNKIPTDSAGTFTFIDTLHTKRHSCDSIHVFTLTVHPVYSFTIDTTVCQQSDSFDWEGHQGHRLAMTDGDSTDVISLANTGDYEYTDHLYSIYGCDSIYTLRLHVKPTYNEPVSITDTAICDNQRYNFHTTKHDNDSIYNKDLNLRREDTIPYYIDIRGTDITVFGCDSAVHHRLCIYHTYRKESSYRVCQGGDDDFYSWYGHDRNQAGQPDYIWDDKRKKRIGRDKIPTNVQIGEYIYIDSLKTVSCRKCIDGGCDSIWTLHLTIDSVYQDTTHKTISEEDYFVWQDTVYIGNKVLQDTLPNSLSTWEKVIIPSTRITYKSDKFFETTRLCDSTFHLTLTIGKTYRDTITRYTCDNVPYHWYHKGDSREARTDLLLQEPGYYYDSLTTVGYGFDSIYVLNLLNNKTFHNDITDSVCRMDNSFYQWVGHTSDSLFYVEGHRRIGSNEISISNSGNYTFIDSLKTKHYNLAEGQESEEGCCTGCDSIWTLHLYVKPQYYLYDTTQYLAANDTISWYDRYYQGAGFGWHHSRNDNGYQNHKDSVYFDDDLYRCLFCDDSDYRNGGFFSRDTVFFDTIPGKTVLGCDSIHYLRMEIRHAGDTIIDATACDNDFVYLFEYIYSITGTPTTDIIRFEPHYNNIDTAHKDTLFFERDYKMLTVNGDDSIVHLHLTVYPTYRNFETRTVCVGDTFTWRDKVFYAEKDSTYYDSLPTELWGCDSVYVLGVHVPPTDYQIIYDTVCLNHDYILYDTLHFDYGRIDTIIQDTVFHRNHQGIVIGKQNDYNIYDSDEGCPALRRKIVLYVCPAYLNGHLTNKPQSSDNDTIIITSDSLLHWNGYKFGLDTVYPVGTYIPPLDTIIGDTTLTTEDSHEIPSFEIFNGDTIHATHIPCNCDSTYRAFVRIFPVYQQRDTNMFCETDTLVWQNRLYVGREWRNYHPDAVIDSSLYQRGVETIAYDNHPDGIYIDTVQYHTATYGFDSIYHLHIFVSKVYRVDEPRRVCQTDTGYFYNNYDNGKGGWLQAAYLSDSLIRNDTLLTAAGCDSIVTLHFYVDSIYSYQQDTSVCQLKGGIFAWVNQFGDTLGNIPIDSSGLKLIPQQYHTIHGCDSIFTLNLYVAPTYYYGETITICDKDTVSWQGMLLAGSKYAGTYDTTLYDSILIRESGIYNFTIERHTHQYNCDSTFHLNLMVNPTYEIMTYATTCDNEPYVWNTKDIEGEHQQTIYTPRKHREPTEYILPYLADTPRKQLCDSVLPPFSTMLRTINGCDSLVHLQLTVKPTYLFVSDTTICQGDTVHWRGFDYNFNNTDPGKYEYKYTADENECDSTYVLRIQVASSFYAYKQVELCDNETIYHPLDTTVSPHYSIIWEPSMGIMDYTERHYSTYEGCDSIFHYALTIYPTFDSVRAVTPCSNVWEELHARRDVSLDTIYHITGIQRQPIDTTFIDTLKTIHGCDSVFRLQATVYPAYRHTDYDTVCSNETYTWRQHLCRFAEAGTAYRDDDPYTQDLYFHNAGDTVYYDIYETDHGCDSIYELRLHIKQSYEYAVSKTMCFDELPYINGDIKVGTGDITTHLVADYTWTYSNTYRFLTYENCDSIIHLSLTVYDTTSTHLIDTICAYQRYYPFDHDPLTANKDISVYHDAAGFYVDSTLNYHGCKHATFTHLTVIPPTGFTLNLPPVCADEKTLDVSYEYTGRPIEEFSVLFDSLAHTQGFEDIHHVPITDLKNQIFEIPVPHGDTLPMPNPPYFETWSGYPSYVKEHKYQYVRPGIYGMKVILHNGLCDDEFQTKDTLLNILYPSWIHEQHWNDGIVLFNEIYNGGYTFSHYQWYLNDEPIIGQVREYLYWPDSLALNWKSDINGRNCINEYRLLLTRKDDGVSQFTCPICPIRIYDRIVPQKDYFAVVPTYIVNQYRYVWILSSKPVTYQIFSALPPVLSTEPRRVVPNDNNFCGQIEIPKYLGLQAIVILTTDDGERRVFRIMIAP